jgi:SAM-dependent methyltransferase
VVLSSIVMPQKNYEAKYWDQLAQKRGDRQDFDELLAEQYRRVHLNLLDRWTGIGPSQTILKTDLFAEAMHPHRAFLWSILPRAGNVVGIDISGEIVLRAKVRAGERAPTGHAGFVCCDVRQLPFANNCFDLIVSDSTLDHFHRKEDIAVALSELSRVLKPGSTLIITLDNRSNLTEPFFRLWVSLGFYRVFIGRTYSMRELEQALARVNLKVVARTAIIHNPRFFARGIITLLRRAVPGRFDHWIRNVLLFLDSLESRRTRYLTAQFIAAKAVKPVNREASWIFSRSNWQQWE